MAEEVILLLVILILGREYLSNKERKDLYNRLMARNLEEVKEMEGETPSAEAPAPDSLPPDIVPLSELSDEAFDDIIQETLNREESEEEGAIKKLKRKATHGKKT